MMNEKVEKIEPIVFFPNPIECQFLLQWLSNN